ncbi:DUF397 domain-containing protein [Solihabitans fulvus]|uniref:DUF397 domain-containing protein n=1 Tax=Solihabitans fulvus TaxID=1892852 RepID=A0A5B2X6C0_9PSEU|nr:DUF397 domain-containing protein [Solihabitans fulvus]KAA2258770.1 DUF397 domain-containing protein [Solihabitans fulvus]
MESVESGELLRWRKGSRTSAGGADCVELAGLGDGTAVRDSKNRDGGALTFAEAGWARFMMSAKSGDFDLAD